MDDRTSRGRTIKTEAVSLETPSGQPEWYAIVGKNLRSTNGTQVRDSNEHARMYVTGRGFGKGSPHAR